MPEGRDTGKQVKQPLLKLLSQRVSKIGGFTKTAPASATSTSKSVTDHAKQSHIHAKQVRESIRPQVQMPANTVWSTLRKADGSTQMYAQHPNYVADTYRVEKTIGEGAYAKVMLCTVIATGEEVALKVSTKADMAPYIQKNYRREAEIMWKLNHPYIVKLLEVIETETFFVLVIERVEGEEILEYIVRNKFLSEKETQKYAIQLIEALRHMHSVGVVHRDLKTENILLDTRRNIKVIDFGLSSIWSQGTKLKTFCGSPVYAAPELIKGRPYTGPEVDVWSLGMNIYAMLAGKLPYSSSSMRRLLAKMVKGEFAIRSEWSQNCVDFIKAVLVVSPTERPTLDQVANHPWITHRSVEYQRSLLDAKRKKCNYDKIQAIICSPPRVSIPLAHVSIRLDAIGTVMPDIEQSTSGCTKMGPTTDSRRNTKSPTIDSVPHTPPHSAATAAQLERSKATTASGEAPHPGPPTRIRHKDGRRTEQPEQPEKQQT